MSPAPHPRMHGLTHVAGGPDPIPGLLTSTAGTTWESLVRDPDLTAWWRMGDTFTFAGTVVDALIDSADFDADSPRNLDYTETWSSERPTLGVANAELGADDDGAVEFNSTLFANGQHFTSHATATATATNNVTRFGVTADLARSVTCWIKPIDTSLGYAAPYVGRWGMDTTGSFNLGWVIEVLDDLTLQFKNYNTTANVTLTSPGPLTDGAWHHVAVTWDGTTWSLYINGGLADTAAGTTPPGDATDPATFNLGFGNYDLGATDRDQFCNGGLDEVAIYKKTLSAGEILTLAEGPIPATASVVTSLAATGETGLTGDVTLSAGTNVTLTQAGQNIEIAAAAGEPVDATQVWMPLTTVTGGVPELVWDGDDQLIPTLTDL